MPGHNDHERIQPVTPHGPAGVGTPCRTTLQMQISGTCGCADRREGVASVRLSAAPVNAPLTIHGER